MSGLDSFRGRPRTSFTRRAVLLGVVQACGLAALAARLYQLQVMERSRYAPLADANRIDVEAIAPVRGRLFDRGGHLVARNDESFHVAIRLSDRNDPRPSLDLLARIVPIGESERAEALKRAEKRKYGSPLVLARDLTFEQVAAINLLAPQLPGVETGTTYRRRYDHGVAMGHVTGYIGRVEAFALDDDPILRLDSLKIGKAGAELGFDLDLRGQGGSRRFEVDARGRIIRILDESEPTTGGDVVLAVDLPLQERVVERLASEGGSGALVVLDVESGEIVAMGSTPTYDPGLLKDKLTDEAWQDIADAEHLSLFNRCASGLYPPGSTFKMVTALAALEAGVVKPDEHVNCRGSYDLADRTFRCWRRQGHGRVDLHRALRESCDVYFYELAHRTGIDAIAAMGKRLGLGQIYDCGVPAQKRGVVPDADWKKAAFRRPWLGGETVLAGIGQGYVLTSPLQLAVMTARIATGRAVQPALRRTEGGKAAEFPRLAIDERWLAAVRRGMVAAVNEDGGTGGRAQVEGVEVAGKTGTSQVVANSSRREDGADADTRDHALFVSYFPAGSPRYAIAAVVENGGGGGATAAPLVSDIIGSILKDDPVSRPPPQEVAPARTREGPVPGSET